MNIFRVIRLPDLITLLNVSFGFSALLTAARMDQNAPQTAVIFILLAVMADGLDGFLARRVGSSPLGASLDSLADLVSFGVAPVFLALQTIDLSPQVLLAGFFFLVCGTLRLARFNTSGKSDRFFEGLPIPVAGIALSASVLLDRQVIIFPLMLLLSLLMVSSFSYPKIRDLRAFFILGMILFGLVFFIWMGNDALYATLLLAAVILVYMVSPVVISFIQKGK